MEKKYRPILAACLVLAALLGSCDILDQLLNPKSDYWKLTGFEFRGVKPLPSDQSYQSFATFPFAVSYDDGTRTHVYTGQEGSVRRTDTLKSDNSQKYKDFIWTPLPREVEPGVEFDVVFHGGGTAGNGIGVSEPTYYADANVAAGACYDTTPVTVKLGMDEPDAAAGHQKIKVIVSMSSGYFYYMEWWYIYEWISG